MQLTASQPDFIPPHRYLAENIYFPEGNYAGYFQEERTVARLRHNATAEKTIDAEEKGYNGGGLHGLLEARLRTAQDQYGHGLGSAFDVASAHAALGRERRGTEVSRHRLPATRPLSGSAWLGGRVSTAASGSHLPRTCEQDRSATRKLNGGEWRDIES